MEVTVINIRERRNLTARISGTSWQLDRRKFQHLLREQRSRGILDIGVAILDHVGLTRDNHSQLWFIIDQLDSLSRCFRCAICAHPKLTAWTDAVTRRWT